VVVKLILSHWDTAGGNCETGHWVLIV